MKQFTALYEPSVLPQVTVQAYSSLSATEEPPAVTYVVAVPEGFAHVALPDCAGGSSSAAALQAAQELHGFTGKQGEVLPPQVLAGGSSSSGLAGSAMLLGLGKAEQLSKLQWGRNAWHAAGHALAAAAKTYALRHVTVDLTQLAGPEAPHVPAAAPPAVAAAGSVLGVDCLQSAALTSLVAAALTGLYEGTIRYKTSKPVSKVKLESIRLAVQEGPAGLPQAQQAAARGVALARATLLAQYLVEAPANVCTPSHLAAAAQHLAAGDPQHFTLQVHDAPAVRAMGMGLFLGVAQGSAEPLKLVHLAYTPAGGPPGKVVALVGKGLTFDSGGYNLKVQGGIQTMKCDMGGAGAILGAARAISMMRPQGVQVHFITAACENMVSGSATRPGDIHISAAGLSVEVNDTDAEGRLTLADALWYAQQQAGAKIVVDIATLTGAAGVALGSSTGALFASDDELAQALERAGREAGEKFWRLPLDRDLCKQLESPIADLKNYAGRPGGAITAALFLQEFISAGSCWAHLDIAGPAWEDDSGLPTGFGAATLAQWVMDLAAA